MRESCAASELRGRINAALQAVSGPALHASCCALGTRLSIERALCSAVLMRLRLRPTAAAQERVALCSLDVRMPLHGRARRRDNRRLLQADATCDAAARRCHVARCCCERMLQRSGACERPEIAYGAACAALA